MDAPYLVEYKSVPEGGVEAIGSLQVVEVCRNRLAEERALQSGSFTGHNGRVIYAVEDTRDEGDEVRLEDLDVLEET